MLGQTAISRAATRVSTTMAAARRAVDSGVQLNMSLQHSILMTDVSYGLQLCMQPPVQLAFMLQQLVYRGVLNLPPTPVHLT